METENWQRDYIIDQLYELIQLTTCDSVFIAKLQSDKILGPGDISALASTPDDISRSTKLYRTAITRNEGYYEKLIHALYVTNQTGALQILVDGYTKNKVEIPNEIKGLSASRPAIESNHNHQYMLPGPRMHFETFANHYYHAPQPVFFGMPHNAYSYLPMGGPQPVCFIPPAPGQIASTSHQAIQFHPSQTEPGPTPAKFPRYHLESTEVPSIPPKPSEEQMEPQYYFQSVPKGVYEFLSSQKSFLLISTLDINLTVQRLQQFFPDASVTSYPRKFKLSNEANLNIVEISQSAKLKAVLEATEKAKLTKPKIITVVCEPKSTIDQKLQNDSMLDKVITTEDILTWTDLTEPLTKLLKSRNIQFQNKSMPLNTLLSKFNWDKTNEQVQKELQGQILIDLINDCSPEICSITSNRPIPSYYINRKLLPRRYISASILQEDNSSDKYAISEIELYHLSIIVGRDNLGKSFEVDTSRNQLLQSTLTAKFIVLEGTSLGDREEEFKFLCKNCVTNIHWLKYISDSHFEWIKTQGYVGNLHNHIDIRKEILIDDKVFHTQVDNPCVPICISDTPGMGKSVLLTFFAETIKEQFPTQFVKVFTISEFMKNVENVGWKRETIDTLLIDKDDSALWKSLLKSCIHPEAQTCKEIKCELMFDGLDEVPTETVSKFNEILDILKSLPNIRIWATTRPHLMNKLEETLDVLGFRIHPFNEADQINFLCKFWTRPLFEDNNEYRQRTCKDTDSLREFAAECVNGLHGKMTDFENEMAGVPLQCLLLAEVYEDRAEEYSTRAKERIKFDVLQIMVTSMTGLYSDVVNKKLRIYLKKSNSDNNPLVMDIIKARMDSIHMKFSIQLLFPKYMGKFSKIFEPLEEIKIDELCAYGLVESINSSNDHSQIRFVHRTFAEFYLARFVFNFSLGNLNLDSQPYSEEMANDMGMFLANDILALGDVDKALLQEDFMELDSRNLLGAHFLYPVISYFMNSFLESEQTEIKPSVISGLSQHFKEDSISFQFVASFRHDYTEITKILVKSLEEEYFKVNILKLEKPNRILDFLSVAAKHSSLATVKYLFSLMESCCTDSYVANALKSKPSPFDMAVHRGSFQIVRYLVLDKGLDNSVWQNKRPYAYIPSLHVLQTCVFKSFNNDKRVIEEKKQIIKFLKGMSSPDRENIFEQKAFPRQCTPVLEENASFELLKCLIEEGANAQARDINKGSLLHLIPWRRLSEHNEEEFFSWIRFLLDQGLSINCENGVKQIPLHIAVTSPLNPRTIEFLQECGADFKAEDEYGQTVIFNAMQSQTPKSFKMLMEISKINVVDGGYVHLAVMARNLPVLKVFIEELNVDINVQDEDGNSLLHLALSLSQQDAKSYDIVKYLIHKGIRVSATNKKGNTALCEGLVDHGVEIKWETLQLMKDCGVDLVGNGASKCVAALFQLQPQPQPRSNEYIGYTDFTQVARFLIEDCNAGVNWRDEKSGQNLLHLAAKNGLLQGVKLLLDEYNFAPDTPDKCKNNPLHVAMKVDLKPSDHHEEVVKLLVERGANVNLENNLGETALVSLLHSGKAQLQSLNYVSNSTRSEFKSRFQMMTRYLVERGAKADIKLKGANLSLLHLAFSALLNYYSSTFASSN